ncbi:hypothetical protein LTR84_007491 [Exophiala bonariae]|uniref:Mid2 domain-containing protein n=1 Tax=Exophiala bonariae TaxID=1690606 RepID=A0AAV9MYF7_9EURO|nr:hypothetical protein LTR84_007491 [Exophiala bonariae]
MDRPAKRMKISNPDIRNPRDTGSRMTEGLFTSEQGIRGGDQDHGARPTRTISLSEFQKRNKYSNYQHLRPILPRRNAGIYLLPRAPDATVTASVIEVNVNDGTSTSKVTEIPAATTGTVVELSDVGQVTVPGVASATDATGTTTTSSGTITTSSITPPPSSSTTSTSLSPAGSVLSDALNSTTTLSDTSSQERTVTITATSTFEVSLINGTVIVTGTSKDTTITKTGTNIVTASRSSSSAEYTFNQLDPGEITTTGYLSSYSVESTDYFTGAVNTGIAGSPTASSPSSATSDSDSGSSGPGLTPKQQTVVGGVVGGVAGVALALVVVLFVLRWYRRHLKARGELPEQIAARDLAGGTGPSYPMSQRSSTVPFAAAVAHNIRRLRPHSNQTVDTAITATTDLSARDSERGFQRIAGRKIAPVLGSGGDPYGGNYGAFEKEIGASHETPPGDKGRGLSGASFYRDSDGFHGGNGTHSPTFPPSPTIATSEARTGDVATTVGSASSTRDFARPTFPTALKSGSQLSLTSPSKPDGFAVMRPSPARTPVTLSPAASSIRLPIQQAPTLDENAPPLPMNVPILGMHRDAVGRSLASQDGSRVSKSSGRSAGRFVENM